MGIEGTCNDEPRSVSAVCNHLQSRLSRYERNRDRRSRLVFSPQFTGIAESAGEINRAGNFSRFQVDGFITRNDCKIKNFARRH